MREDYDFTNAKQGAVIDSSGKTRITIMLDTGVINSFRKRAEETGTGYQTEINRALREYLERGERAPTIEEFEMVLRQVVREEIHSELHAA